MRDTLLAGAYDTFLGAITNLFIEPTVAAAAIAPGESVVDLGAGLGHLGRAASDAGGRVLLVDRSQAMLDAAHAGHYELDTVRADGAALPMGAATVDVVLAGFYLNHHDDLAGALREIRRVLRPGGRLCATVWGDAAGARHNSVIAEAVAEVGGGPAPVLAPDGRPTTIELRDALAATGFVHAAVRELPATTTVRSAAHLLWGMRSTTWQSARQIASVPADRYEELHAAVTRLIEPYRTPEGFAVPVGARLITAAASA